MGVGTVVTIWLARYLGRVDYGLLNYAMAFVALFGPLASLGLSDIVVRDLAKDPRAANTTLGTTFVLQLGGGILALVLVVIAISFARPNENLPKLMVSVLGLAMVFRNSGAVKYWFESQIQSKYAIWVENGAFLFFAVTKLSLIYLHAPLMAFVWTVLVENALVLFGLLVMYSARGGSLSSWRIDVTRVITLLRDGWPLILSGLAIMVYMRIDQIMLGQIDGDAAVGIYTAAVRISEVWYFIPTAIVASVFPSMISVRKRGNLIYQRRFQMLYDLMAFLSLVVALPMTFLSGTIVTLLFGEAYSSAGAVLAVHVWAGIFVSLGVASARWFLLENLLSSLFYRTVIGAIVNVGLNLILIPAFGVVGAAIATLFSYSVAAFWYDIFTAKTRPSFIMKLKSFAVWRLVIQAHSFRDFYKISDIDT